MSPREKQQLKHAVRRAKERYGLYLTKHDYLNLVSQVRQGKATCVGRDSLRVTVWVVAHIGVEMLAVYDSVRGRIATFLPMRSKSQYEKGLVPVPFSDEGGSDE